MCHVGLFAMSCSCSRSSSRRSARIYQRQRLKWNLLLCHTSVSVEWQSVCQRVGEIGAGARAVQDSVKQNACLTLLVADCIALFGQHCTWVCNRDVFHNLNMNIYIYRFLFFCCCCKDFNVQTKLRTCLSHKLPANFVCFSICKQQWGNGKEKERDR